MMAMSEDRHQDRAVSLKTVALAALLGLVVLLSIGAIAGAVARWIESPQNWGEPTLAIAGAVFVGATATLGLLWLKRWTGSREPVSPKTHNANPTAPRIRRARMLFWLSIPFGVVIASALLYGSPAGPDRNPLGNGPISQAAAMLAIGVWLVAFLGSWLWWRNVDEHEAAAYTFGSLVAVHFYAFVTPAWWVGWRGGFLPEPQHMHVFVSVAVVSCIAWFWRRYR